MDARKNKFERGDLEEVFAGLTKLIVGKGKKVLEFDLNDPDWDEIATHALGRSGTLRAPTVKRGKTGLVGFHAEAWDAAF